MKKIIVPLFSALVASSAVSAATIEERLSELELKQDMSFVKFGGRFFGSYDNVEFQTRSTQNAAYTTNTLNFMRLQFSLNMDADISPKLKFYSRYTTSKYFNHFHRSTTALGDTTTNAPMDNSTNRDLGISDNFDAGPATFLERAYFNYAINDYLIFSLGRLPTVDGPPLHMGDNVSREGTYAHLAYSNVLDGVATTVNLNSMMPQGNSLSLRFIYTPFTNISGTDSTTGNISAVSLSGGRKLHSESPLYVGMAEYALKGKSFGDILVLGQVLKAKDLVYLRHATLGEVTADYSTYSLYADITNIMNTGIDFSATGFISETKNTSIIAALGGGAYSSVLNATHTGHALLLTTRYTLPVTMLKNPIFGAEYIYGDKYFNKSDNVSKDVVGFYNTRGNGIHVYYTQPLETGLKFRLGFIDKTDHYGRAISLGDVTPARKINNKSTNIYAQVRLDF